MAELEEVLRKAVDDKASDIFIVAGGYLSYKVNGEIKPISGAERMMPTEALEGDVPEKWRRRFFLCH